MQFVSNDNIFFPYIEIGIKINSRYVAVLYSHKKGNELGNISFSCGLFEFAWDITGSEHWSEPYNVW